MQAISRFHTCYSIHAYASATRRVVLRAATAHEAVAQLYRFRLHANYCTSLEWRQGQLIGNDSEVEML
jgi:hypothetical protein